MCVCVCVCVCVAGEEDGMTNVYIILLRQIHGSTVVMTLFNVCFRLFISFYCIADVYNSFFCF